MKKAFYLLIAILFLANCQKQTDTPTLQKLYRAINPTGTFSVSSV